MEATTGASADHRGAILAAALEQFTEHGFAATTIEQIRQQSGASVGSIYHHFGGKEGIAAELYVEGLRAYQAEFLHELERHAGTEDAIRALVRHHLRWVERNPRLARLLMNRRETELRLATEARVRALNRAFMPRVAAWLDDRVEAGELRPIPIDLWEPILLGPVQEFTRLWLAGRTRTSLRRATEDLSRAAWNAVRAERQ